MVGAMASSDRPDEHLGDRSGAEAERRSAALRRLALRSRVRAVTGGRLDPADHDVDPGVSGLIDGGHAYYQADDPRGLGPAIRWARSNGATALTLLAEADVAGDLARRAELLGVRSGPADAGAGSTITVEVWSARGPDVEPARPSDLRPVPALPPAHRRFASMIAEAGARPVDDHGLLVAEVAGLEVARVVDDLDGGGPRLAVGVGQADRELQSFIHGHLDDDANLRRAIGAVVRHRRPGSANHPLSRLSRQRWLRSVLIDEPGRLGLDALEPLAPLRPPRTLLSQEPVAARSSSAVVVCSVGVDLDLLPEAADYRYREDPGAELIVVVPERDRQLVGGPLAELVPGLRLVSIAAPWEPAAGG